MQPSASKVAEEEPVTEIEHIQYADEGVVQNDTDSDDSDWKNISHFTRTLCEYIFLFFNQRKLYSQN